MMFNEPTPRYPVVLLAPGVVPALPADGFLSLHLPDRCRVLQSTSQPLPLGRLVVAAFLLSPSQSASCERAFAELTTIRQRLHDPSPALMLAYLQVGWYSSLGAGDARAAFLRDCASAYLSTERRMSHGELGVYMVGKRVISRKRKLRSDKGATRGKYKLTKKYAGLRSQSTARQMQRNAEAKVATQPAEATAGSASSITQLMSPRRKSEKHGCILSSSER